MLARLIRRIYLLQSNNKLVLRETESYDVIDCTKELHFGAEITYENPYKITKVR